MQPNNPYDFITNPAKAPRKSFFSRGGDPKQRTLMMIIGGGLVLIVIILILSVFLGGNSGDANSLSSLASQQQEIVRVSDIALGKAKTQSTKNLASTVQFGIQSAQVRTLARLSDIGNPVSSKTLLLSTNSQTTKTLTDADSANTFDETYTKIVQTLLDNYLVSLKDTYNRASSNEDKQLLESLFTEASALTAK